MKHLIAGGKLFIAVSNIVPLEFWSAAVNSAQKRGLVPCAYRGLELLAIGSAAGVRRELIEDMVAATGFIVVIATTDERNLIENVPPARERALTGQARPSLLRAGA